MTAPRPRIGAYLLTGDPTWLASSLSRYYDLLDDLVVLVPDGDLSWMGRPLPVQACLDAVAAVDVDSKARVVRGEWIDRDKPSRAETAQRRAGLAALVDVDWILQIDNDELLPDTDALLTVLAWADSAGIDAVEWPMRVLYRRVRGGDYLEVVDRNGGSRFEYPGPVAVRPSARLVEYRRTSSYLRPAVRGDRSSVQVNRDVEPGEVRVELLEPREAILHNSWGRSPTSIWRKIGSSAHQLGWRGTAYFALVWFPAPVTWRWLRNVHPLSRSLWPRLGRHTMPKELLDSGRARNP